MFSERYLENQVFSADPLGLVLLLYEGAGDAIRRARDLMREGRIAERSSAVTKAMQIVAELQGSLDLKRGGEVAQNLARLYVFIQERLVEANAEQKLAPLEEAARILEILREGWKEVCIVPPSPAPLQEQEMVVAGSVAWTL
jgi:flagellar protein FliS